MMLIATAWTLKFCLLERISCTLNSQSILSSTSTNLFPSFTSWTAWSNFFRGLWASWVHHLVPHIRCYRKRNWQFGCIWGSCLKSQYKLSCALGIHIINIIVWPKDSTVNYKQEINCCIAWCSISIRWSHLRDALVHYLYLTVMSRKFLLEQKQNYGISDHGLWLKSLDIIIVDLKSRDFHTLCRWGRGTTLGQICT